MRIGMILTFFVFLSGDMALAQGLSREWKDKNKLIVVTTADWNASQGTLVLYERKPQVAGDRPPGLDVRRASLCGGRPLPSAAVGSGAWRIDGGRFRGIAECGYARSSLR